MTTTVAETTKLLRLDPDTCTAAVIYRLARGSAIYRSKRNHELLPWMQGPRASVLRDAAAGRLSLAGAECALAVL